jgi:IclR family acetate operon transcriptional repressor
MTFNLSVLRAITILEYLAESGESRRLSTISDDLQMNRSTVHRFLGTLTHAGYVRRDESGLYALGHKVSWLASKFLSSLDLRKLARPILERIAEGTGETVHLAVLDRYEVSYIDKIPGRQAVQMTSRVGIRGPAHCTGLGKAMLAFLPESEWGSYLSEVGLEAYTDNTITDPEAFFDHLRQIRDKGYSFDKAEHEEGILCVAAPIHDHTGATVAALSITGWSLTMTPERLRNLAPLAKEGAQEISALLGFDPSSSDSELYGDVESEATTA